MKDFNIIVARVPNSADRLLVVPFDKDFDFTQHSTFTESEFLVFLTKLGFTADEAQGTLERSRPAPRSFELHLVLSDKQSEYAWSQFPLVAEVG